MTSELESESIFTKWNQYRSNLPCPGTFENLHKEVKNTLPSLFMVEGAKFDIASIVSSNFSVIHSFSWGNSMAPSAYHLGGNFMHSKGQISSQIDSTGSVMARGQYNWIPVPVPTHPSSDSPDQSPPKPSPPPEVTSATKFHSQFPNGGLGQKVVQFEHEHVDRNFSLSLKAVNPLYFSKISGIPESFAIAGLQSISKSLAIGAEYTFPRYPSDVSAPAWTFAFKFTPPCDPILAPPSLPVGMQSPYMPVNPRDPPQVFTTSYSPSTGIIQSTYWRRLNQRLELGTELQLLTGGGRREGIASAGFKLDTVFATLRASFDTQGRLSTVLEERIAPGVGIHLCGEMDYGKGNGGQGKVGIGFTLEM